MEGHCREGLELQFEKEGYEAKVVSVVPGILDVTLKKLGTDK